MRFICLKENKGLFGGQTTQQDPPFSYNIPNMNMGDCKKHLLILLHLADFFASTLKLEK